MKKKGLLGPWAVMVTALLLVGVVLLLGSRPVEVIGGAPFTELSLRQLVPVREATGGADWCFGCAPGDLGAPGSRAEARPFDEPPTRQEDQRAFHKLKPLQVPGVTVADIDTVVKSGAAATELEGAGLSWREYYQKADNIIPYALIQPGDEQWVIRARAQKEDTHGLVQSAFSPQLLVVGMAVLIVLLSLSYAVAMSLRTAKLLERKVEAKTEDLRDYHEKLRVALDDLEVAHTFLQSIIDGVGEPIMVVGSDYRVKLMNLAAREFAHGDTNPSEPLFCYQVSHHNEAPCMGTQHPCPMERVRESGQPVTVLHEHYQANGEPRFVEVIASPLWGADGSFQGIIEAVRDLTERLTTEGMLTEQIEELAPDELERFSTKVIGSIQDLFAELPPG